MGALWKQGFYLLRELLALRGCCCYFNYKVTVSLPHYYAFDLSDLIEIYDNPFSNASNRRSTNKNTGCRYIFRLAEMIAPSFDYVVSTERERRTWVPTLFFSFLLLEDGGWLGHLAIS